MAFLLFKTLRVVLPVSALLLQPFLFMSVAVAHRNAIFSPFAAEPCDCCDLSLTSRCCLDCVEARTPETEVESTPLSARLSREGAESYPAGEQMKSGFPGQGSDRQGWHAWWESSLGACQCCVRAFTSQTLKGSLLGLTCCSACKDVSAHAPGSKNVLPSRVRLPFLHDDDVSSHVAQRMTSPVKRMTSMDCMCCMNSGISDCCSKCRIF